MERTIVLSEMVVEDAPKADTPAKDEKLKHLVERTLRMGAPGLVAADLLDKLIKLGVDEGKLPKTFRELYDDLVYAFVTTKNEELRTRLAEVIRRHKTPLHADGVWAAALREGLAKGHCSAETLRQFVAASTAQDNRTAVIKMIQCRAGAAEYGGSINQLIFEARCGEAAGDHLSLIGEACLKMIKQAADVVTTTRAIRFPNGAPYPYRTTMPTIDRIVYTWQSAVWPQEQQKEIEQAAVWMKDAVQSLQRQVGYKSTRTFDIELRWHILPREYGWEHKRDELVPLAKVEREV